jgi:hypothetical protein
MEQNADDALVIIPPEGGALALSIPEGKALAFFTRPGAIDPVLAAIRKEVDAFKGDAKTEKGRKAIKSMAFKITQSKTYIESVGKAVAADAKEIPKKVDASRKRLRDTLDAWAEEVRKPVTEWEEEEDFRITRHKSAIQALLDAKNLSHEAQPATIRASLEAVESMIIGPACEEFEAEYANAKESARTHLLACIEKAERREAEQAELVRLRKESEERAERDRIAAIERAAADKARADAEAKAKEEREAAERRELDLKLAAERAARDAKEREERARLDAECREYELQREKEAAERRAAETEARVKREAEEAKEQEEAAAQAREADLEHRRSINRKAVAALIDGGLDETFAMLAISLIATRKIPHVTISY